MCRTCSIHRRAGSLYQATIIRSERNYEAGCWVAYDRLFRRGALARKDLNWSIPDQRLYNEAFMGRAKLLPRCSYCLEEDHVDQFCPANPNRPWFRWLPQPATYGAAGLLHVPHHQMKSVAGMTRHPKVPLSDMHVVTVPVHTQQSLAPGHHGLNIGGV